MCLCFALTLRNNTHYVPWGESVRKFSSAYSIFVSEVSRNLQVHGYSLELKETYLSGFDSEMFRLKACLLYQILLK